ncbi:hypothetical protein D9M73_201440 [compost metagenome]
MALQKLSLASRMMPSGLNSIIAMERLMAASLALMLAKTRLHCSISSKSDLR